MCPLVPIDRKNQVCSFDLPVLYEVLVWHRHACHQPASTDDCGSLGFAPVRATRPSGKRGPSMTCTIPCNKAHRRRWKTTSFQVHATSPQLYKAREVTYTCRIVHVWHVIAHRANRDVSMHYLSANAASRGRDVSPWGIPWYT